MENDIQVVTEQPKELNLELAERRERLYMQSAYQMFVSGMIYPIGAYFAENPQLVDSHISFRAIEAKLYESRKILEELKQQLEIQQAEAFKPQE